MAGYISKPIDIKEIEKTLKKCFLKKCVKKWRKYQQ